MEEYYLVPEVRTPEFKEHCIQEGLKLIGFEKENLSKDVFDESIKIVETHGKMYFDWWKNDPIEPLDVEKEFLTPLPSSSRPFSLPDPASFYGRADLPCNYGGAVTIIDHKLLSWQYAYRLEAGIELDTQLVGYAWGLKKAFGLEVTQGMYNLSVKVKDPKRVHRRPLRQITQDDLDTWERNFTVWRELRDSRDPEDISTWPQNTDACFLYGECNYWDICAYGERGGYVERKEEFPSL